MLKKLLALALAGAMVLGSMSLTAFADDGDAPFDNSLVISGLKQGDQVHFYQVLGWEEAGAANATIPNSAGGWIYTSAFKPGMTADPAIAVSSITGNPNTGITSEIAGRIARLAVGEGVVKEANAQGIATYSDVPAAGLYLAIITPVDVNTVYNPVFVSADFNTENPSASWNVTEDSSYAASSVAAAKKSTLQIQKSASTIEQSPDDGKPQTTAVGDTVSFTVNTTIPGYGEIYTSPTFIMKDTLTDLEMNTSQQNAIAVSSASGALTKGTDYTVVPTSNGYTITFASSYLKGLSVPTPITVTYEALVTTAAVKNVNEEKNTVEINYSHNPQDSSGKALKAKKDTTQHYTFTIDAMNLGDSTQSIGRSGSELIKVGVDSQGNPITSIRTSSNITSGAYQTGPLAGAHFKLYRDERCTEEYQPKNEDGTDAAKLDIVSDAAGRLLIQGLDAGVYWLKETQAPAGYMKDPDPVRIEIQATIVKKNITEYYTVNETTGEVTWSETNNGGTPFTYETEILESYKVLVGPAKEEAAKHTFMNRSESGTKIIWESSEPTKVIETPKSIVNRQGVELPSTGGVGTTIFYMGGAMLILLAGVLLVSKRRMAA